MDPLQKRVHLHLQGHARQALGVAAKANARRLRQVVEGLVDELDVVGVELYAAALQQVQQVGPGLLRYLPHGARLHRDVPRLLHPLQHGDGVA